VTAVAATTKGFDAVVVVHALLAIASLVVLVVLRTDAAAVARDPSATAARRSFTGRRELAGRTVHLVPLTGLVLLGLSRGRYGIDTGFVLVGLGAWFVAAGLLEGVAFPAQRVAAADLADGRDARPAAARMVRAVELAALCVVVAAIAMIAGPS
jgi:hypothetical protein